MTDYQPHDELYLARVAIQRVRELHKINPHACEHCGPFCEECGHEYPCATILTLDGGAE